MSAAEILSLAAAATTIVAGVAVVATAWIYYRQLNTMTKARETESLIAIMNYANDRELLHTRHFMLEHASAFSDLFTVPFSPQSRGAIDARLRDLSSGEVTVDSVDSALSAINNVSYLVRYGYAPVEASEALLKNSLLHSWSAFALYVAYRRTRPDTFHGPSRYAEHFEWLVREKYGFDERELPNIQMEPKRSGS